MPSALERVRVLAPADVPLNASSLSSARQSTVPPFSPERVQVLEALSQRILQHAELRRDPAAASLAFWLRRAHVAALEREFRTPSDAGSITVPAGLVFHIAPANVDTMFILSWALAFLGGNASIVRLTSSPSTLTQSLLNLLKDAFADHASAVHGNWFVSYDHDDEVTEAISLECDTRLIWGGDETVRRIRRVPMNPHAGERAFASKRSLSVFDATAYGLLASDDRDRLAASMAGDVAPFGQMGCSSPHVVHWLRESSWEARKDFSERLENAMGQKIAPDIGSAARRITFAFAAAAENRAVEIRHASLTTTVHVRQAAEAESADVCGAGLLTHAGLAHIDELKVSLRRDHQTITYFGLDEKHRSLLAQIAGFAGVDRVVPVGRALEFEPYWDGYDVWSDVTRRVIVH